MSSPFETAMKIGVLVVTVFMIYLIIAGGVTLAYYLRVGKGEIDGMWYGERQKWIPKKWISWAGYPSTFSNLSQVNVTNKTLLKKVKATSAKTCMLSCDGENERSATKCVGFLFNNTECYLASSLDGIITNSASSNVLYLVDGPDTSIRQYYQNTNKAPSTAGYYVQNGLTIDKCASNCLSNVECNGFTFVSSSGSCGLYSGMDETKFVATTGVDSYVLKEHQELNPLNDVIYWKS